MQLKVDNALGVMLLSLAGSSLLCLVSLEELMNELLLVEDLVVLVNLATFGLLLAFKEDVMFLFFLVGYGLLFMVK